MRFKGLSSAVQRSFLVPRVNLWVDIKTALKWLHLIVALELPEKNIL